MDEIDTWPLAISPRTVNLRPVAMRVQQRTYGSPMWAPTEAEKHDAIMLLADDYQDDVGYEALRILDEYGR